ncbi:MAG: hypothetical protein ACI4WG_07230 [Erysipelotrichaceae bacterium]
MAEKKEKKYVATENAGKTPVKTTKEERRQKATGKRVAAVIFWLLAVAMEVLFILILNKTIWFPFFVENDIWVYIGLLVLDLVFVIIGSQFWKKANDVDPASEKNKVKFFLWNQMGLIVSVIAFLPMIIILLSNKELDKKTKKIVSAVAAVCLVVACVTGIDFSPISEEERNTLESTLTAEVYYTPFGKKYHTHDDCQALANSTTIYHGPIADALDAGRTELCKFCAEKDGN